MTPTRVLFSLSLVLAANTLRPVLTPAADALKCDLAQYKAASGLTASVDQDLLVIPRTCFKQADLSKSAIELPGRYDLAICLEVAEHLPSNRAEQFVSFLTTLSDHVLFSAAIPLQGGVGHLNEQWQHYWAELFADRRFAVSDCIRPAIWNDDKIPFWYKQNILLFSKQKEGDGVHLDSSSIDASSMPLDLVHPDLYLRLKVPTQISVRSSLRMLRQSLTRYIAKKRN